MSAVLPCFLFFDQQKLKFIVMNYEPLTDSNFNAGHRGDVKSEA